MEDAQPPPVKKTKEELQDEKALKVKIYAANYCGCLL